MLDRIGDFARLLRHNGVRVSTAEILDASRAVAAVGVDRPDAVRAAMAATLIKNRADRPTFDELFELYFYRFQALTRAREDAHRLEPGDEPADRAPDGRSDDLSDGRSDGALPDELDAAMAGEMLDAALSLGPVARAAMGLGAPEFAAMVRALEAEIQLDDIRSPLQVGFYAYRMAEALGLGQAESEALSFARAAAARIAGAKGRDPDAVARVLERRMRAGFEDLRQRLRAYVRRAFELANRDFARDLAREALAEKPLTQLSEKEIAELRHEVARLAERLRAKVAARPEFRRRGRLDLRRTLRGSLAAGGVPFALVHRRRRRHKPRLVVLCDVSDSVRAVSRFMLQLVYTLQELFDRVQSFAFVAELGELTDLFRQYDLERAIEATYAGAVVSTFANSNYGRSLDDFAARHMDRLTRRTTLVIIGDGRNNYHASRAAVLGDMRRRAKQVLWLTPEPPSMWSFGDSCMAEYAAHCDRVMVVRNLEGLRKVLDHLTL